MKSLLSGVDLDAVAGAGDKFNECRFYFSLVEKQHEKDKFRWLLSAFFSAAYSYFEMSAFHACVSEEAPVTGKVVADEALLSAVRNYVEVQQNAKYASYVRTFGPRRSLKKLYELRHQNTHWCPLWIMAAGESLPEDFQLGWEIGKGIPALELCRAIMVEIGQLEFKKEACEAGAWPPLSNGDLGGGV